MDDVLQNVIDDTMTLAKGISDYGLFVVLTACFLVLTVATSVTWLIISRKQNSHLMEQFNSLMKNMIESQQAKIDAILEYSKKADIKIIQLKEAMTGEEFNKIRVAANYGFDYNKLSIAMAISEIKEANNLSNRADVEKNARMTIDNLYNRFSAELNNYEYNGQKVSTFLEPEWKERIYDFAIKAIYDAETSGCKQNLRVLTHHFDDFKVKFFDKLKKNY